MAHITERLLVPRNVAKSDNDQDSSKNTTVYEKMLIGQPHGTSVKKATSDNENVVAV